MELCLWILNAGYSVTQNIFSVSKKLSNSFLTDVTIYLLPATYPGPDWGYKAKMIHVSNKSMTYTWTELEWAWDQLMYAYPDVHALINDKNDFDELYS